MEWWSVSELCIDNLGRVWTPKYFRGAGLGFERKKFISGSGRVTTCAGRVWYRPNPPYIRPIAILNYEVVIQAGNCIKWKVISLIIEIVSIFFMTGILLRIRIILLGRIWCILLYIKKIKKIFQRLLKLCAHYFFMHVGIKGKVKCFWWMKQWPNQ